MIFILAILLALNPVFVFPALGVFFIVDKNNLISSKGDNHLYNLGIYFLVFCLFVYTTKYFSFKGEIPFVYLIITSINIFLFGSFLTCDFKYNIHLPSLKLFSITIILFIICSIGHYFFIEKIGTRAVFFYKRPTQLSFVLVILNAYYNEIVLLNNGKRPAYFIDILTMLIITLTGTKKDLALVFSKLIIKPQITKLIVIGFATFFCLLYFFSNLHIQREFDYEYDKGRLSIWNKAVAAISTNNNIFHDEWPYYLGYTTGGVPYSFPHNGLLQIVGELGYLGPFAWIFIQFSLFLKCKEKKALDIYLIFLIYDLFSINLVFNADPRSCILLYFSLKICGLRVKRIKMKS